MTAPIPHDMPCVYCGHPFHHWLTCECGCSHELWPGDAA